MEGRPKDHHHPDQDPEDLDLEDRETAHKDHAHHNKVHRQGRDLRASRQGQDQGDQDQVLNPDCALHRHPARDPEGLRPDKDLLRLSVEKPSDSGK